jgi:hypothetical protein
MTSTALFELLACLLALVAAVFIFDQYLERPRPYKLLWTLGLAFYGIAAGAAFAGETGHWSVADYKVWYYFGGVLTAAYLGLGSLWLQAPRPVARWVVGIAVAISLYTGLRLLLLPVDATHVLDLATWPTVKITNASDFSITPPDVLVLVILMNISGALMLFGGAAWSAWTFYRKHAPGYRLMSMVLLALGSVFPGILTGLQRLGYSAAAPLGEFLGAGCILAGLLVSLDVFTVFRIPFTRIVLRQRVTTPAQQVASPQ